MNIAIIDYEAGNIGSVKYAIEQCGFDCYIVFDAPDLLHASHIILPGVGTFYKAMQILRERQLDIAIKNAVIEKKVPILGICLGMQLLATQGIEGGSTRGLGFISGDVPLLQSTLNDTRLPHIGWNEVTYSTSNILFDNIASGTDFYFLHSYHLNAQNEHSAKANTYYGCSFISAIIKDNICGVQFHPEKSGKAGKQILKNFVLNVK